MVSRLVEADGDTRRPRVDGEHVALWPRELRTPALLVEVARSAADVALLVASWCSQGTGSAQAPLTIMFDTSALATATGSGPLAFNSSTAPLTADNVYVYFEQAGPMSVVVGGTALTYSSGTWVYGSGTYTGGMSPGFSVSTINNSGGIQATSINGSNMFIAYGANAFGDQPTPSFSTATRFAVIEPNYSSTSGVRVPWGR